jgi:hypothetical protein
VDVVRPCISQPTGPLVPEYGNCDVCGTKGCYPLRHEYLENDAQALRFARIVARDNTENGRARLLAEWVVAELTKRKHKESR